MGEVNKKENKVAAKQEKLSYDELNQYLNSFFKRIKCCVLRFRNCQLKLLQKMEVYV